MEDPQEQPRRYQFSLQNLFKLMVVCALLSLGMRVSQSGALMCVVLFLLGAALLALSESEDLSRFGAGLIGAVGVWLALSSMVVGGILALSAAVVQFND
jgi:hypothetical protein